MILQALACLKQFVVHWPLLAVRPPSSCSLPILDRAGEENKMKNLVGWGKDKDITYQLPSQAKKETIWEKSIKFIAS